MNYKKYGSLSALRQIFFFVTWRNIVFAEISEFLKQKSLKEW